MRKPKSVQENEMNKILSDINSSPNHDQKTTPCYNLQKKKKKKKKKTIADFAVPANHRVKIKESENKDKYFNFAREQKKKS